MISTEKLAEFAKENCSPIDGASPKSAEEWGNWNEYKVYVPDYDFRESGEEPPEIGLPEFILVKDKTVRLADIEETDKIMADGECTIPDEEDE